MKTVLEFVKAMRFIATAGLAGNYGDLQQWQLLLTEAAVFVKVGVT